METAEAGLQVSGLGFSFSVLCFQLFFEEDFFFFCHGGEKKKSHLRVLMCLF